MSILIRYYFFGKFLISHKKLVIPYWIKKIQLTYWPWVEILFLIGHPSVKVGEQLSFLPLTTFLCLTFLLNMKLDNMSFKM
jgi:hypothetical protein